MIKTGKHNLLYILRSTDYGLFLGDDDGEEVLLPNRYCPKDFELDEEINVFVYIDKSERKIATTQKPKLELYEFARLRVESVTDAGAFMDWGMDKHLFVPASEQRTPMDVDKYYFIYMMKDPRTEKLYGTKRVERYLQNDEITVSEGEKVDLLVYQDAEFGLSVIVNNNHKGMVYKNEIFKDLKIGDYLKGYVKNIRDDSKLDISIQPLGYRNFIDPTTQLLLDSLEAADGFIPLNDKSKPEEIYSKFAISKKAFKKAVGSLFKQKLIEITDDGIKLTSQDQED
ncbi:MAG: S1-like domain-containing RNA-binding protein [Spirochaetaceae bacterium]